MIDTESLLFQLQSKDEETKQKAVAIVKTLKPGDMQALIRTAKKNSSLTQLNLLITGKKEVVINPNKIKLSSLIKTKKPQNITKEIKSYGIYTVSDANFFPGIIANINSLRYHGYQSPIAIIDIGLEPWMVKYLQQYDNVKILDIKPLKDIIRFTDTKTDESPIMKGWAYKAFGIVHFDLFQCWTFIDADYFPMCNPEQHIKPLLSYGKFVCTEDGHNTWEEKHQQATGVKPGKYMNINAGFISVNMETHGHIIHEWRNLMTRKQPFQLWYGDQGALNVILDKHGIEKTLLDKRIWNQTLINPDIIGRDLATTQDGKPYHKEAGKPFMGWHGMLFDKLWHQIGIDHYRKDQTEREKFYKECQGKSPRCIVDEFKRMLFLDKFNKPLQQKGFLLCTT
jgi:hypothetical protein